MSDPNKPPSSEYQRVEKVLADLTPDPRHLGGSIYPIDEVERDLKHLDDYKHTLKFKETENWSDSVLLEKTFIDAVERGDWFGEDESYGNDPNYSALVTSPTSEIDDVFNHIDVIGMISNEATEHEVTPFAIDLTWNTDSEGMTNKFKWRHAYGKRRNAPAGASEFGEIYTNEEGVLEARRLKLKYRYGLKIPGFASAKYYEDKNNGQDPVHEKGRIYIMPRFIVGYSKEIAKTLAEEMPDIDYLKKYGEEAYQEKRMECENAERCAKWCTLFECHEQASDIRFMLEHMDAEETKWMQPEELEKAKKQIIAMDTYFTKAVELATKKAQTNPDEMAAMKYADEDMVRKAIMHRSFSIYILKSWKNSKK